MSKCDCNPYFTGDFCDGNDQLLLRVPAMNINFVIEDVNECELGFHSCDVLTECINLSPGYNCTPCPPGYIDQFGNGHKCIGILYMSTLYYIV